MCATVESNDSRSIIITSVVILSCIVVIYAYGKSGNDLDRPFNARIVYQNYQSCTPLIMMDADQ